MEKKISKEEWVELTKKLRNRVSAYFNPEQLEPLTSSFALPDRDHPLTKSFSSGPEDEAGFFRLSYLQTVLVFSPASV